MSNTTTNNKAFTLSTDAQSALYNDGKALAIAEAGFDFSVQSCIESVIKTAKATKTAPMPFETFDVITRAMMAGYDGKKLDAKYTLSDAARQKRSRIKSGLTSEYAIIVADKPAATSKDAKAKAEQREKAEAVKIANAERIAEYMARENVGENVAADELMNRETTAAGRKQIRQAAAYMADQAEKLHTERVKAAKAKIAKFMADIKGNTASVEQLEILEQMAAIL